MQLDDLAGGTALSLIAKPTGTRPEPQRYLEHWCQGVKTIFNFLCLLVAKNVAINKKRRELTNNL